MTATDSPTRRRRRRVAALLLVSAGGLLVVANGLEPPQASAATIGTIVLDPASGAFSAPTTFTASGECPAATTAFRVTITGGGVPQDVILDQPGNQPDNLVGTSSLEGTKTVAEVAIAAGTFQDFANSNGSGAAYTLAGPTTVSILCIDLTDQFNEKILGDFTSTVTFSGTGAATTYATTAAPGATPTPTPTGSPTPTPASGTPTPTPAAEEPTPTPEADDATPTPEPDGDDDANTDEDNGSLPGTGGQDPTPFFMLAGMLGIAGAAILLFESATRYREDWE